MADAEPTYDKADDIGKLVKLSDKSIYRLAKEDPTFPCVKIGGSLRFPRERVLRWLAQRTQGK
jgi:predicted DNA-binding transcriptional regulator AlpA